MAETEATQYLVTALLNLKMVMISHVNCLSKSAYRMKSIHLNKRIQLLP